MSGPLPDGFIQLTTPESQQGQGGAKSSAKRNWKNVSKMALPGHDPKGIYDFSSGDQQGC
jgi:hypothetical protein